MLGRDPDPNRRMQLFTDAIILTRPTAPESKGLDSVKRRVGREFVERKSPGDRRRGRADALDHRRPFE